MKGKRFIIYALAAGLLNSQPISAGYTYLISKTANTYARSYHDDNYFADKYLGEVSIRGADRFYEGNNICYPTFTRLTYDVQGKPSVVSVNSNGMNDTAVRQNSITVYDEWNLGPKTQVYGNYGYGYTGGIATDIPDTQD